MNRLLRAMALTVLVAGACAQSASAHAGNPNYRSVFRSVNPPVPGLTVDVLGFDNQMQITNRSGKPVVIDGYSDEPYARLLPDGTVQVNERSPADYLNDDRFARVTVPPSADPKAAPQWKTLDKTGRFVWHDHRMHWMSTAKPSQVEDDHAKTKIFDYEIPLDVAGRPATLNGTLFWVGPADTAVPAWAFVSLGLLLVIAIALLVRRRRHSRAPARRPRAEGVGEAW